MTDIIFEAIRVLIISGTVIYLSFYSVKICGYEPPDGWKWIMSGLILLLFSATLDITDNFPQLNRFMVIGDTGIESFLEKVIGSCFGFLFIAIGLINFGPYVIRMQNEICKRRESEEKYRDLLESTSEGFWLIDTELKTVEVNESLSTMLGYSQDEMLGKRIFDFVDDENRKIFLEQSAKISTVKHRSYEITLRKKNGENLHTMINATTITNNSGDVQGSFAFINDISERRQAEKAIRQKTEEWKKTFNAISDCITIRDTDLKIVQANQAACTTLDLPCDEINGRHCYELFHDSKEPCQDCPIIETKKTLEPCSREMYYETFGKTYLVSATPVFDEQGELEFIAHVAKDLSDLIKLEKELFQAQKMEAIGTLAGGIAHDFNNILSGIIGFSLLIKNEVIADSKIGNDIVEIIEAGKRAADLVKQILTFSRKTDSSKTPLRPHLIVKEALKLLRATLPTTIRIEEDIDPQCGTILADPTNIHQTVINLCTNALHAMSEEKGTLSVSLTRQELNVSELDGEIGTSPGPFVVLSVSDTGCGMDQKTIDRIFDPYFTTKEVGTGTGLGLAVIHGIAQTVQGFVRVKSTPEEGSTFAVYLPALQEKDAVGDKPVEITAQQRGHERILIVDDEAFLVKATQKQLENLGYHVTGTTDSKDALQKIRTDPDRFDLLITDQTMPDLTGAELAMVVKEIKSSMPIIICTGHSGVLTKEKSYAIGIDRYISKPIMGNELSDAVRSLLDKK